MQKMKSKKKKNDAPPMNKIRAHFFARFPYEKKK